jgi:hypothetical protein
MAWEGRILDGSIEEWAGGLPVWQNIQQNNTVIHQLQKDINPLHPQRQMHHQFLPTPSDAVWGPHVLDGYSSLRAEIAAAAAVDAFRIWSPGAVNVAFAGASTNDIPVEPFRPMTFRFAARAIDGNLIRVRIVFRTAADAIAGYVTQAEEIQAAAAVIALGTVPTWAWYSVSFVPPQQIGANVLEHIIWQISNGVAGAQILDIDAISLKPTDEQEES